MSRLSPTTLAHILLLTVVAVWGATFAVVKDALQDASPLLFNTLRMSIAAVVLATVNYRSLRRLDRRAVLSGLIVGAFLAAGYQFQTSGLARTTAAKSAFITGLVVVFVPILTAIPAIRPPSAHAPRWTAIVGAVLAFGGLLFLTTPPGTTWSNLFSSISTGDMLTLVCALAFSGHLLALSYASPRVPTGQLATLQIASAALLMACSLPLGRPLYLHITPRLLVALAVTSLFATAAAFTVQSWAQQHLPPTHTALLLTMEPVFAWLISFFFLGERLGSRSVTGALLIFAGILITELFPVADPVPTFPAS